MHPSPYLLAQYAIYWVFPTAIDREACIVQANERYKFAYQESDDSVWILKEVSPAVWKKTGGSGAGAISRGIAIVDFGEFPGSSNTEIVITGQDSISSDSIVKAFLLAKDTDDHTAIEHAFESLDVVAGNIVAGEGFTIYVKDSSVVLNTDKHPMPYGKWSIAWEWA